MSFLRHFHAHQALELEGTLEQAHAAGLDNNLIAPQFFNYFPDKTLFFGWRSSNTASDARWKQAFILGGSNEQSRDQAQSGVREFPMERVNTGNVALRFTTASYTDFGHSATGFDTRRICMFGGDDANGFPGARVKCCHWSNASGIKTNNSYVAATTSMHGYVVINSTL